MSPLVPDQVPRTFVSQVANQLNEDLLFDRLQRVSYSGSVAALGASKATRCMGFAVGFGEGHSRRSHFWKIKRR